MCEKSQIARENVVVIVTTTFKSGGDMSPPSHTKLRLCKKYHICSSILIERFLHLLSYGEMYS